MEGRLLPHPCRCEQERLDREAAEQEARRHHQAVADLKRRGFTDPAMRGWTFANDNGKCPQMKHAHFYVENWTAMQEENIGYLLWGGVGTGKSYFAGCIAKARRAARQGKPRACAPSRALPCQEIRLIRLKPPGQPCAQAWLARWFHHTAQIPGKQCGSTIFYRSCSKVIHCFKFNYLRGAIFFVCFAQLSRGRGWKGVRSGGSLYFK